MFAGTYLPHKEVIKNETATTKVRAVSNRKAKIKNKVTLHDILHTGV